MAQLQLQQERGEFMAKKQEERVGRPKEMRVRGILAEPG